MEKISFFDILAASWRLSFAKKKFFLFGFCIALPLASQFLLPLPEGNLDVTRLLELMQTHPAATFLFFSFYFLLTLVGRSGLIPALSTELSSTLPKQSAKPLPIPSLWKNLKKTLLLESVIGLFLLLLFFVLSLPSLISAVTVQTIPEALPLLGLLIFIPMLIITFFVREFSLFYFLLSPLRLITAFERGSTLFIKQKTGSLLFGVFSLVVNALFTFSLNLAMLGGVVLGRQLPLTLPESLLLFTISLLSIVWYAVFSQALWLHFFISIATPKNPIPQKEVSEVLLKESVPESPTV